MPVPLPGKSINEMIMAGPLVRDTIDAGASYERRGGNRQCTVYRLARIEREGDAGLWRVRNISDHGMMLATTVAVDPGERLQIALSEQTRLTGKVVWTREGRCGVEFDEAVDAVDILRRSAEHTSELQSLMRISYAVFSLK